MNQLLDGDFELDGFLLSGSASDGLAIRAVQRNASKDRTQDEYNPAGDSIHMGRDFRSPPTWVLSLAVGHGPQPEVMQQLSQVARAWRNAPRGPGEESILRFGIGGQIRRMYGRARNFHPEPEDLFALGQLLATAEFHPWESVQYGDTATSVTLGLIYQGDGGLVSPLVSPLTTTASTPRQGLLNVAGDAPTPVEVTFKGPVINPSVSSSGWEIALNSTLAYDQSVTIDTRLGTVLRSDGASLAGALSRRTYLPDARLEPGAREIIYRGTDATGTSTCTVAYRPAFYGL